MKTEQKTKRKEEILLKMEKNSIFDYKETGKLEESEMRAERERREDKRREKKNSLAILLK